MQSYALLITLTSINHPQPLFSIEINLRSPICEAQNNQTNNELSERWSHLILHFVSFHK